MVADIFPGASSSSPSAFANVNGTLFFEARESTFGRELYKSDGTAMGTVLVKDINPGSAGSVPAQLIKSGGTLYFNATDGMNGTELWKSDGTDAGTVMVKDINNGFGSVPHSLTVVDGSLFFSANDGLNGFELWKSDGTESGTVLLKDINPLGDSNAILTNLIYVQSVGESPLLLGNGRFLFGADDGNIGFEPYVSDGTEAGTVLIKELNVMGDGFHFDI